MSQCWRFYGKGTSPPYDSYNYEFFACGTTPEYRRAAVGQYPGFNLYLDGVNIAGDTYQYGSNHGVSAVADSTPTPGFNTSGSCGNCKASAYDCLNGNCVDSTQYKTPGQYPDLKACQSICGSGGVCGNGKICIDPNNYCPDGKACLDQSEVSQINSLLSKVQGEVC